jgi:hypothetical protein
MRASGLSQRSSSAVVVRADQTLPMPASMSIR